MGTIKVDLELCKGCYLCLDACAKHLLVVSDTYNSKGYRTILMIESEKCTGCKLCAIMCPDSVIEVYK